MAVDETQSGALWLDQPGGEARQGARPALVLLWSLSEPARLGEVAWLQPGRQLTLGRGAAVDRVLFGAPARPLEATGLSRNQLSLCVTPEGLEVEQTGRGALRLHGESCARGLISPGETLTLEKQLVLMYQLREGPEHPAPQPRSFGRADAWGLVGEGPAMHTLREQLRFCAGMEAHVLLHGASGAGKELVARALHLASRRAHRPLVSRNAATLPTGLIDAELFGNLRNYPQAGMPERPGLIGEADGATLFLDEIGDLPEALQVHLLRVMDRGGEYQRLGESAPRRVDLRLIAATNKPLSALRNDFLARFALRVEVPGLEARREDIPLLARHLVLRLARTEPLVGERFVEGWTGADGEPRLAPDLVEQLVAHEYTQHTRELESLLLTSISSSPGHFLAATPQVLERLAPPPPAPRQGPLPTREEVEAALARNEGSVTRTWRELGLSSRDALNRLMKKLGVSR